MLADLDDVPDSRPIRPPTAPHGIWLGTNGGVSQPQHVDAARIAAIEARLKALEGQP